MGKIAFKITQHKVAKQTGNKQYPITQILWKKLIFAPKHFVFNVINPAPIYIIIYIFIIIFIYFILFYNLYLYFIIISNSF